MAKIPSSWQSGQDRLDKSSSARGQIVGGDLATFPGCEKQMDMPIANEMRGICGLVNMGNTCFMNAGLQCIISNPRIAYFFLSAYRAHRATLNEQFKQLVAAVREDEERRRCAVSTKNSDGTGVEVGSGTGESENEPVSTSDTPSSTAVPSVTAAACAFGSFAADLDSELRASAAYRLSGSKEGVTTVSSVSTATSTTAQNKPKDGMLQKYFTETPGPIQGPAPAPIGPSALAADDLAHTRAFSALVDSDALARRQSAALGDDFKHAKKLITAADIDVANNDVADALRRSSFLQARANVAAPQPPPPPPPPPPPHVQVQSQLKVLQSHQSETSNCGDKALGIENMDTTVATSVLCNAPVQVDDEILTVIHSVDRHDEISRTRIGKSRLSAVASLLEQKFTAIRTGADTSVIDVDTDVGVETNAQVDTNCDTTALERSTKVQEAAVITSATSVGPETEAGRRGAQFRRMVERCVRQIALVDSLHDLVEYAWSGRAASAVFKPRRFKQHLGALFIQFANARQHDAQEFLAVLLDCAHEVLNVRRSPFAAAERHFRDASRLLDELDAVDRRVAAAAAADKATQCLPPPNGCNADVDADADADPVADSLGGLSKRRSKIENGNVNVDDEPTNADCLAMQMRVDSEKFRNATPAAANDSECETLALALANGSGTFDKAAQTVAEKAMTLSLGVNLLNGNAACHNVNTHVNLSVASTSSVAEQVLDAPDSDLHVQNGTKVRLPCAVTECKPTNVQLEQETTVSSTADCLDVGAACPEEVVVRLNKRLRIDSNRPQPAASADNAVIDSCVDVRLANGSSNSARAAPLDDVESSRSRSPKVALPGDDLSAGAECAVQVPLVRHADLSIERMDADSAPTFGHPAAASHNTGAHGQSGTSNLDTSACGLAPDGHATRSSELSGATRVVDAPEPESDGESEWLSYLSRNDSAIADAFHGQLRSVIVCSACAYRSVTYEPFMYLPVPIPRAMQAIVTVLFVPAANDTPTRYCISMFQNDPVTALKRELLKLAGAPDECELVICETAGSTVLRIVRDDKTLIRSLSQRQLVAVELCPPPATPLPRPIVGPADSACANQAPTEPSNSGTENTTIPQKAAECAPSTTDLTQPPQNTTNTTSEPFPELSRCQICLDEFRADVMRVHPACNLMLCVDCVTKCAEHASGGVAGGRFGCPGECHEQVTAEDYVPVATLYAACSLLLSGGADTMPTHTVYLTVLFRNDSVADASGVQAATGVTSQPALAECSPAVQRELFGHALVVALPNRVTAEALWNEVDRLVPSCLADCSYQICLTDCNGLRCTRCDIQTRCAGCPISRDEQRVLLLRDSHDAVTIVFECLSSEQRTAAGAVREHDSVKLARSLDATLTLHDCVRAFADPETLDCDNPWLCPRCDRPQPATKTLSISRFPDTLIIYLKRFVFHALESYKANETVLFPYESLSMTEYGARPLNAAADASTNDSVRSTLGSNTDNTYDLTGIVCHFGGVNAGHYTAYTRHAVSHCWHYFNDETVTQREPADDDFRNAYVLFYTRSPHAAASACDERADLMATLPRVVLYRPLQETDDYEQLSSRSPDQQPVLALTYQPAPTPAPTPTSSADDAQMPYYGPYLPGCEPRFPLCVRDSLSQEPAVSSSSDVLAGNHSGPVPASPAAAVSTQTSPNDATLTSGPTPMQVDANQSTYDGDEQLAIALSLEDNY